MGKKKSGAWSGKKSNQQQHAAPSHEPSAAAPSAATSEGKMTQKTKSSVYARCYADGVADNYLSIDDANALITEYVELATRNRTNQAVHNYLNDSLAKDPVEV